MLSVFLNGRFLDGDAAPVSLSAFDAGLQHGVGLFETMLGGVGGAGGGAGDQPRVVHLDRHLDRLAASARELGLASALHAGPLGEAVLETVRRSGLARARVRLTVTGGDLNMLAAAKSDPGASASAPPSTPRRHDPTILIVAQPATAYPDSMLDRGVVVALADARTNPLDPTAGHKTLNYWWRLRELQRASAQGAAEALVFSVTNHVVGGCVSSILLVKGDGLLVPIARGEEQKTTGGKPGTAESAATLPSPVLPGVTREAMIEAAEGLGWLTQRRMLTIDDVLTADEVILTNSSWGVLPVVGVEAAKIGKGDRSAKPGPVARDLRAAWERMVAEGSA